MVIGAPCVGGGMLTAVAERGFVRVLQVEVRLVVMVLLLGQFHVQGFQPVLSAFIVLGEPAL